jgi:hypothetical protein
LQLEQERAGNTLEAICILKGFLSPLSAEQLRERIDKWDYRKLKSFCTTKEMVFKLKKPSTEWKKIFSNNTSDKAITTRLIARIHREFKNKTSMNQ